MSAQIPSSSTAILLLEDGSVFHGISAGKTGIVTGEICFNTGMTGYQEVFTDPSYFGQILVTTNPHIGNYGIHANEVESDSVKISGLVCKKFVVEYSRKQAIDSIQKYFLENQIVVIADVDTRALVRHIRSKGAMNAIISSTEMAIGELNKMLAKVPSMAGLELSSKVSVKKGYSLGPRNASYRIAVLDLGVKKNILRCLVERKCEIEVFPMNTKYKDLIKSKPDGILLSNGPGDPAAMTEVISTVKEILANNIPVFGICLGHQILAIAAGLSTYKMHNGHRGLNHPVMNIETGECEITSQNHGFSVSYDNASSESAIELTHINLNDNSVEGIKLKNKRAFSVQHHPESSAGPNDSRYLFDQFIQMINSSKKVDKPVVSTIEENE